MSYTSAVTRRFKEAILWAATTRSGHMVQERDTRICICTLWSMARIRSLMAGSRGCPGPAALYNPRIKEVNSCPPGTPWKANPVFSPEAVSTSTKGSKAAESEAESASCTVSLSVYFSSSVIQPFNSWLTGRESRCRSSCRFPSILENTTFSWFMISCEKIPAEDFPSVSFPAGDSL